MNEAQASQASRSPRTAPAPIIELSAVCKAYAKPSGEPLPVLIDINLTINEGEIVGLLGRSGCGKSTLLRTIGGLISPTSGSVLYRGQPLLGPPAGIAIVFQSFALFPWLTVLENVEIALDALALKRDEVRRKALAAIDLIGLDGFQSAYPREISGGMRQRVGFARALAIEPALMLMDEPFSALDVLTAETLRTDLVEMWREGRLPLKSILLVTHNIEEAVLMCDRAVILSSNPGRIAAEIAIPLPHPRDRQDPRFRELVDEIYGVLTQRRIEVTPTAGSSIAQLLPRASAIAMVGLIEAVAAPPFNNRADLAELARSLNFEIDDLFPLADGLHLLQFAELTEGELTLTADGARLAQMSTDERKALFAQHLVRCVPLAAHVVEVLNRREEHRAPRRRFQLELEDHLSPEHADGVLRTVINWGRYAELFTYDTRTHTFEAFQPLTGNGEPDVESARGSP
ncbi:MAG TPA: nitrate/sulfonate/bicarbonate ABC transporter ATP-binding protein [Candidatus Binataceae bacterium]|nr:nitrate/sulfonate/bicarbonate ABC transporter ATP-binding protein [Candidatus Binataceae bacterium]